MMRILTGHFFAAALVCAEMVLGLAAPPVNAQVLEWVRQPGGSISEPENSWGVSADGLGNVYITGSGGFGESVITNMGMEDAFLSKFDAAGLLQWTQRIETDRPEVANSVSADGLGNVYISGWTMGVGGEHDPRTDAFVAKYDAAGLLQWTRQFGTNVFDGARGVSADGLGNVYVVGETDGNLADPNAQTPAFHDAFVRKYDAEGELQWSRQLGTGGSGRAVSADGLGNVYISGASDNAYVRKYDTAGNLEWTRELGAGIAGVSADVLGNVFVSGPVLHKFDAAGNVVWTKEPGDNTFGVSADGLGNVYLSRSVSSGAGIDVSLSKYDGAGILQWTTLLETHQPDFRSDVSADGLGNVYVSGDVLVRPFGCCPIDPGDIDLFLAKYNDCPDCEPPPIPPVVVDVSLGGLILPGSLVTHQFTTSFGDVPVTWSSLTAVRPTTNPPTLTESGLFSWKTTKLDAGGLYQFDVTATNTGGSDTGRLTLRLAIIPEPSAVLLVWLGIGALMMVLRARR
jgi:hypothetical protein